MLKNDPAYKKYLLKLLIKKEGTHLTYSTNLILQLPQQVSTPTPMETREDIFSDSVTSRHPFSKRSKTPGEGFSRDNASCHKEKLGFI